MRRRWQVVLPIVGLILFSAITVHSVRYHLSNFRSGHRYFWWGAERLDKTPGQNPPQVLTAPTPCNDRSVENCVEWNPEHIWIEPGLFERVLIIAALPAFALGAAIVSGLSRFGVSQVTSFFVSMPVLIFLWFYAIGRFVDAKFSRRRLAPPAG
jgi:hypothetical protein